MRVENELSKVSYENSSENEDMALHSEKNRICLFIDNYITKNIFTKDFSTSMRTEENNN